MLDLDAWLAEQAGEPFVSFRLAGREFWVRCPLPAAPAVRLATEDATAAVCADYVRSVLVVDSVDDFMAAIETSGISAEGLFEIVKHVQSESAGRPTTRRPESSGSPRTTGPRSRTGSRRKGSTTRAPSLSVAS